MKIMILLLKIVVHGSNGTLAQFNLKTGINFEEGENYTPIKKTSVNIEVPKIGNYNPTRVEVINKIY